MQIESSSVDMMARKLCKNAVKNSHVASGANQQWIILSLMAEGHLRAAALIEKEIKAMKNRMEKDNA